MDFLINLFNTYIIAPINYLLGLIHVTLPSTVVLIIGLFVVLKIFDTTQSLIKTIRSAAIVFMIASLVNAFTLPPQFHQDITWLVPQTAIPLGIIVILGTYMGRILLARGRYKIYGLILTSFLSLFGLGYVKSYLSPTGAVNGIYRHFPGIGRSFNSVSNSIKDKIGGMVNGNKFSNVNSSNSTITLGDKIEYGSLKDKIATPSLSSSIMTDEVAQKLGNSIQYNKEGYFVVDRNKPNIENKRTSAWVHITPKNARQQLGKAEMTANFSTYQSENRSKTNSNGKSNSATIKPAGWNQLKIKGSSSGTWLWNRGHSLGYAIVGGIDSFDASEANPDNISTQTSMANASSNKNGQNYWEGIVRDAIKKHKTVWYEVEPVYQGNNLVPSATHIEAKSSDGSVSFNVAIPNVQPGVKINYTTGFGQIMGQN